MLLATERFIRPHFSASNWEFQFFAGLRCALDSVWIVDEFSSVKFCSHIESRIVYFSFFFAGKKVFWIIEVWKKCWKKTEKVYLLVFCFLSFPLPLYVHIIYVGTLIKIIIDGSVTSGKGWEYLSKVPWYPPLIYASNVLKIGLGNRQSFMSRSLLSHKKIAEEGFEAVPTVSALIFVPKFAQVFLIILLINFFLKYYFINKNLQ